MTKIVKLLWPGWQRFATERARFVHAFLTQVLDARFAILVATRQLWEIGGIETG